MLLCCNDATPAKVLMYPAGTSTYTTAMCGTRMIASQCSPEMAEASMPSAQKMLLGLHTLSRQAALDPGVSKILLDAVRCVETH